MALLSFVLHHTFLSLLCTPGDTAFIEIVYRHFDGHLVTGQNSDIVHAKLSGDMSRYNMLIRKLYLEGGIRQCLYNRTLKFNYIILRQKNPSLRLGM